MKKILYKNNPVGVITLDLFYLVFISGIIG